MCMPAEERFPSSRAARSWNRPERARGGHMDDAGDVHGDAFSASYGVRAILCPDCSVVAFLRATPRLSYAQRTRLLDTVDCT